MKLSTVATTIFQPFGGGSISPVSAPTVREAVVAWLRTIAATAESGDSFREAVAAFLNGL